MPKVIKVCQVCGNTYEYCHTLRPQISFRWQDVACCQEHGQIWLRNYYAKSTQESALIQEPTSVDEQEANKVESIDPELYIDDDTDDDYDLDDWYDDDDEDEEDEE